MSPPARSDDQAAGAVSGSAAGSAASEGALGELCASLLDDARAGRPGAWERLLSQFGDMVLAVPLEMGLSRSDAEDVFQSTWLALHRSLPRIREPRALAAWILTTAQREALATQRAARRRGAAASPAHDGEEAGAPPDPPDDPALQPWRLLQALERRLLVRDGVETLSPRCRELLTQLYFGSGSPKYADIAAAMRMKLGSVGPTRLRCLARLAAWLESRDIG